MAAPWSSRARDNGPTTGDGSHQRRACTVRPPIRTQPPPAWATGGRRLPPVPGKAAAWVMRSAIVIGAGGAATAAIAGAPATMIAFGNRIVSGAEIAMTLG